MQFAATDSALLETAAGVTTALTSHLDWKEPSQRLGESRTDFSQQPPSTACVVSSEAEGVEMEERWPCSDAFFRLLIRTKAETFAPPKNVVFVCQKDDEAATVFQGMVDHNFLSVPVLQKTKRKYYGFLDMADIVRHVVTIFDSEEMRGKPEFKSVFEKTKVKELMAYPLTRRNPFHPVAQGFSLLTVLELLAREPGLDRVPVISTNEDRKLVNLITQSQVVAFLRQNLDQLGAKGKKPVGHCPQFFHPVHSVHEDLETIKAFNIMLNERIGGLAVIDKKGGLCGNLSLRDLKLVGSNLVQYRLFYRPLGKFLALLDQEYRVIHNRPRAVITANKHDTIGQVIEKLADNCIHRLYIVDMESEVNKPGEKPRPVGLISLKDLLLEILAQ